MEKPATFTQLRPARTKPLDRTGPLVAPVRVTVAPGAAVKVIGAVEVPDAGTVTGSEYVPPATCTVSPAPTARAAAVIVQNGWASVPEPPSEQPPAARSTKRTRPVAAPDEPTASMKAAAVSAVVSAAARVRMCLMAGVSVRPRRG